VKSLPAIASTASVWFVLSLSAHRATSPAGHGLGRQLTRVGHQLRMRIVIELPFKSATVTPSAATFGSIRP
jgi:hypothetical protein